MPGSNAGTGWPITVRASRDGRDRAAAERTRSTPRAETRMNLIVHVVRDDPKRGTVVDPPHLSPRAAFRLKRDVVYTKRKMRLYGLCWTDDTSVLTGVRCWRLEAGSVVAKARDAGLMSFCSIEVAGRSVRHRWLEEEFAGWGGFQIAVLRGTQHVIELLEKHARLAEETME